MIPLAERFEAGVNDVLTRHDIPWHVTRLGCRAEYHFLPDRPRNGSEPRRRAWIPSSSGSCTCGR